ncbi:N-terminal nucleophile aminohydrolase [Schizophyllum commune Loenen D]|nr:N-terminal nucleophile aminohydrolase [Schizophyllum commune Loenen D]
MPLFIAVHGGAGYHAVEDRKATKHALKTSVQAALGLHKSTGDLVVPGSVQGEAGKLNRTIADAEAEATLSAVETAIHVLEDNHILNAGYGSNLTEVGTVECDAAVMSALASAGSDASVSEFGSVAAAPGIKNPVSAARAVLQHARRADVLGRIPPLTLCGHGAQDFARSHDVEVVPGEDLVSDRARADWEYWSAQLRGESLAETVPQAEGHASQRLDAHQDTVGAVCLHFPSSGMPSAAAGVESGKRRSTARGAGQDLSESPVREAAQLSGGWRAVYQVSNGSVSRAHWTGEAIMRANLARRISEELDRAWDAQGQSRIVTSGSDEDDEDFEVIDELDVHQILYDVLKKEFGHGGQAVSWDGCDKPTVGVIVMVGNGEIVRLYSAFTAAGMAIAYAKDDVVDRRTTPNSLRYGPAFVRGVKASNDSFIAYSSPLTRLSAFLNASRPFSRRYRFLLLDHPRSV